MALATELLDAAKNYLDITWDDDAGETKLSGILVRGMAYLDRIAGQPLSYAEDSTERQMLFDYARYVRAGVANEYGVDYLPDLNGLRMDWEVQRKRAAESTDV